MSRLYGVQIDENRWKIEEIDNKNYHTYKLIDKEKEEIYFIRNIIGIEQVASDEFLIYDRYNWDEFRIARYKAEKSSLHRLFEKKFSNFEFITDDRILFNYWDRSARYRISGIYSIKDNDYVKEAKWLNGLAVEVYNNEENNNDIVLYVEDSIISNELGDPKILFTVNPNSLEPNSICYSELRDSFIKVSSKEDIGVIKSADAKYIRIIEDYIFYNEKEQLKNAKNKILSRN